MWTVLMGFGEDTNAVPNRVGVTAFLALHLVSTV